MTIDEESKYQRSSNLSMPLTMVFLLSGCSGLLFETLWFYQAGLALGNSSGAIAVVLSAFMGGLALGNLLAMIRWNTASNPVKIYALLEGIIGISGLLLVLVLPGIGRALSPLLGPVMDHAALVNAIRFLTAFTLLLLPSAAMGYTLPVLTAALTTQGLEFRTTLGRLYGWNTLGAVIGALTAELFFIKHLGITGSAIAASGMNLLASLLGWVISRSWQVSPSEPRLSLRNLLRLDLVPWSLSVAMAGMALLGLEVVWVRFLTLFVRFTSLAFTTMLALVLTGIALGGLAASFLPSRLAWLLRRTSLLPFLAGACCVLSYALFPVYHRAFGTREVFRFIDILAISAPLMLPVSFLSGAFFTLAGSAFRERHPSAQSASGALTLFNTAGAALGAPLASFVLVPRLGMEGAFFVLATLYGLVALLWWWKAQEGPRSLTLGAGLWLLALGCFPFGVMASRHIPLAVARWAPSSNYRILSVREGVTETVVHLESRMFGQPLALRMVTNSYSMSGNNPASRRYMKSFVYWPMLFHPKPTKALLICYGVGQTAKALTDLTELENIDVVDISRDILELSDLAYPDARQHPLKDPRVRVHVEDGRFFLQSTRERYDIITGEPPPPVVPGVASLYSREYFQLLHDRLREGGMATYWLPVDQLGEKVACSILRSFSEVFGECYLWQGSKYDLVMVGIRGLTPPVGEGHFTQAWRSPIIAPELARLGFESPAQFLSGYIGDGEYIRGITKASAALTDNFPKRIIGEVQGEAPLFQSWFNPKLSRERFLASDSIRRRVPGEWVKWSEPFFDLQPLLTSMGQAGRMGSFPYYLPLPLLLAQTRLRTPILWTLGSDGDIQSLLDRLPLEKRGTAEAQFHLGIRQLSERNLQGAFTCFQAASREPSFRRDSVATCLLILCTAGQRKDAERFLEKQQAFTEVRAIPFEYLEWLNRTYAMSIPTSLLPQSH